VDTGVELVVTVANLHTPTVSELRDCPVHGLIETTDDFCPRPIIAEETCGLELESAVRYLRMENGE